MSLLRANTWFDKANYFVTFCQYSIEIYFFQDVSNGLIQSTKEMLQDFFTKLIRQMELQVEVDLIQQQLLLGTFFQIDFILTGAYSW